MLKNFQLENLIDFATSYGKPAWNLLMALEDVEKGEMERIKEFGIRVSHLTLDYVVSYRGRERRVAKSLIMLMNHLKEIIK